MSIRAQKPLDTIFANDKMNVALFFPSPIRQGITGGTNFIFSYNREKEQYFGLIQASPGEQSNLLVITNDGQAYSYFLKYRAQISKLNYFVSKKESIGNEKPNPETRHVLNDTVLKKTDSTVYFERFSEFVLKSRLSSMATKRKKGMRLRLLKVVYSRSEVYVALEIKNKSGIDFAMDYLNISIINENKKRKSSPQKLKQDVIYKHDFPKLILNNSSRRFVCVLPKFVLGDDEKLFIEVRELKGSRHLELKTNL